MERVKWRGSGGGVEGGQEQMDVNGSGWSGMESEVELAGLQADPDITPLLRLVVPSSCNGSICRGS